MTRIAQFPCPRCGYAYSKAVSTTKARSGVDTRRQRTCEKPGCKTGFVTYEVAASDYEFLQAARRFMEHTRNEPKDEEAEASAPRRAVSRVWRGIPRSSNEPRGSFEDQPEGPPSS